MFSAVSYPYWAFLVSLSVDPWGKYVCYSAPIRQCSLMFERNNAWVLFLCLSQDIAAFRAQRCGGDCSPWCPFHQLRRWASKGKQSPFTNCATVLVELLVSYPVGLNGWFFKIIFWGDQTSDSRQRDLRSSKRWFLYFLFFFAMLLTHPECVVSTISHINAIHCPLPPRSPVVEWKSGHMFT